MRNAFCCWLFTWVAAFWGNFESPLYSATEKNIVLFVTDDESPTLGCYDDPVAVTPHIDALARDGMLFTNAFANTASCSPSRATILTGLHSHAHGMYGLQHHFHHFSCYPNVISLSLPQVLKRQGYRTARIGKFHVSPEQVFRFDKTLQGNKRNPVLMAEKCRDFIAAKDSKPFFLYFATSDPHRSGAVNRRSESELKPNLFGNLPNGKSHFEIKEVIYKPDEVPVPSFLPDTRETREELAQYYQSVSRVDQGLGRLVTILRDAGVYDQTMIVFTSDHGMAFAGAKTTVYDAGLRIPFVVRNPYQSKRGLNSNANISLIDIAPTLVDFAGGLDTNYNGPRKWMNPEKYWQEKKEYLEDNRSGGNVFRSYQGASWLKVLDDPTREHRKEIFASHTFHEIQMYYPMRSVRGERFKLIWNVAHPLDFPFAADLWDAASWQAQYRTGPNARYGRKTVRSYLQRPEFELYDIQSDPQETTNLASQSGYLQTLNNLKERMRELQSEFNDPWIRKWDRE